MLAAPGIEENEELPNFWLPCQGNIFHFFSLINLISQTVTEHVIAVPSSTSALMLQVSSLRRPVKLKIFANTKPQKWNLR